MTPFDDEPLEVSILKKQLANISCKCSVCGKHSDSETESSREECKHDKLVQAENVSVEPINQIFGKSDDTHKTRVDFLCNNVSCPGCYIVLNLLKARETKTCKDEETETKAALFCCDKSIEKCVKIAERTTSTSSILPTLKDSNTCLSGKVGKSIGLNGIMKKRSNDHVTFSDYLPSPKQEIDEFQGNCFCLQNFVDSIRPPLAII